MDRHAIRQDSYARFREMLKIRGYATYDDYLASDAWKQFHVWYRRTNLPQSCLVCQSKDFQLHHWHYDNIGQDDPCDVVPLCESHHLELHRWLKKTGDPLHRVNVHLMKCFGIRPGIANPLFAQFTRMKNGQQRRTKRCGKCNNRFSLKSKSDLCHKCIRAANKQLAITIAITKIALKKPVNLIPTVKQPKKPKLFHTIRCGFCNSKMPPMKKPRGIPKCELCVELSNAQDDLNGLRQKHASC